MKRIFFPDEGDLLAQMKWVSDSGKMPAPSHGVFFFAYCPKRLAVAVTFFLFWNIMLHSRNHYTCCISIVLLRIKTKKETFIAKLVNIVHGM